MNGMQPTPNFELPKPVDNGGFETGVDATKESFGSVTPELKVAPVPGERLSQANSAVSQAVTNTPQLPITPQVIPAVKSTQGSPVLAEDNDVMEKEWVDKAKQIVANTQGDPHAKSSQLSGLKEEYIHQRFGKEIATSNDGA
jgi:hypothetical protein